MKNFIFTSEHVAPGHPDKVMDAIAEAVVDHYSEDPKYSRVAVDGLIKNNTVILAGEITSSIGADYEEIVKDVVCKIGYTPSVSPLFNNRNIQVMDLFTEQSSDIAQGVDNDASCESAGDIGIMFGGAVNEAPDFTCWSHFLSRLISCKVYQHNFEWAKPDQKTQVSVRYEDGIPVAVDSVVVCVSHSEDKPLKEIRSEVSEVVKSLLLPFAPALDVNNYTLFVNPTGAFATYGPIADSGEVGRKIVCDQYGGFFPVGGGNLNGKDATKVDRSAVYMARYVSKLVVAQGLADKVQIQVAYAIGVADPVSINIETFGTHKVDLVEIEEFVKTFSFRPGDIIRRFKLSSNLEARGFSYCNLGMYGHIGARLDGSEVLPWEDHELFLKEATENKKCEASE